MAKLKVMPSQAIIDHFKGKVDFYVYKGTPVARKWPHWPARDPSPYELSNQLAFAYAVYAWSALSEYVRQMYRDMAAGTTLAPRDIFMRSYMKGNRF